MRKTVVVAASLALLAVGFLGGRLALSPQPPTASPGSRRLLHYACPMHPAVKSDHPGAAPCCGMALEPVYEGGPAPAAGTPHAVGTVFADADLRQLQGVKLAAVTKATATQSLRLFGRVAADENRVYTVNAAMEGYIRELSGVTTGSLVRRGQKLGSFFSADMRSALQAYMTALDVIDLDPATRVHDGMTVAAGSTPNRNAAYIVERLQSLGVSMAQLREMKARREVPLGIDILSPVDGVVVSRPVTVGQKFDKGAEWFRIVNLDKAWIVADLLEGDAPLARPGARARVTVPGRAEVLTAVVSHVPPTFDAATRTLKLRLEVDNPGALLRPDMYADVELTVERPAALTVPEDAVVDSGLRKTVYVERAEGVLEPRLVETGWRAGGRVEVVRGLAAGERIVVSGTFLVDSESQLRATAGGPTAAAPAATPAMPAAAAASTPAPAGTVKDPICGMAVDDAAASAAGRTAEHHGKHFAFCSDTCKARFLEAPDRFNDAGDHARARTELQAQAGARP